MGLLGGKRCLRYSICGRAVCVVIIADSYNYKLGYVDGHRECFRPLWWENRVENGQKWVIFYGMELPRVGAFTEKWGSGYRNPVHFLGVKWEIYVFSGF